MDRNKFSKLDFINYKIRDGVVEMIKNLKKAEIKQTIMLTGDSVDNAKFIASQARYR